MTDTIPGLPERSILYVSANVHPNNPLRKAVITHMDPWPDLDLNRLIRHLGSRSRRYFTERVYDGTQDELPVDLSGYRGLIVGCSAHSVNPDRGEFALWQKNIIALIRKAVFEYGLPYLGLCGGGQLGLTALGGVVRANPRGVGFTPEKEGSLLIGTTSIELTEIGKTDPIFQGCPSSFGLTAIHSEYMAEIPDDEKFVVLANSIVPNQVIAYGDRVRLFGIHPEVDASFIEETIDPVLDAGAFSSVPREQLRAAFASVCPSPEINGRIIRNFLTEFCARLEPTGPSKKSSIDALDKITRSWEKRAMVRKHTMSTNDVFDTSREDFLPELLPFVEHPRFQAANIEERSQLLSAGWLAYCMKTIDIEKDIILRSCISLYDRQYPGVTNATIQHVISDTLTDESYHIQLTLHAANKTRAYRNLTELKIPRCHVVQEMERVSRRFSERWQKDLILLATAVVTEVFISGFLRSIARAKNVQPMNVLTAKTHLTDELSHSRIFKEIAKLVYRKLNQSEKELFASVLPQAVHFFADKERTVWQAILSQLNFPGGREMINDCVNNDSQSHVDCSELIRLCENELGIVDIRERIYANETRLAS